MKEIESKILDIDKDTVEKQLHALGAQHVFDGELHAKWFDTENKDLRSNDITLRVRKEGERVILGCKIGRATGNVKVLEEKEVAVEDFDSTLVILQALGYRETHEMRKKRTSYTLGDAHIDIDTYTGEHAFIPTFLEIEAPTEAQVLATAKELGFRETDCKSWGAKKLVKYYEHEKNR